MIGGGRGFGALQICNSILCILSEYSSALPVSSSRSTIPVFKASTIVSLAFISIHRSGFYQGTSWPMNLVAEDQWVAHTFFLRIRDSSEDIVHFIGWASIRTIKCSVQQQTSFPMLACYPAEGPCSKLCVHPTV